MGADTIKDNQYKVRREGEKILADVYYYSTDLIFISLDLRVGAKS